MHVLLVQRLCVGFVVVRAVEGRKVYKFLLVNSVVAD